jgi:DNA-binding PucR family transcriptional regulator
MSLTRRLIDEAALSRVYIVISTFSCHLTEDESLRALRALLKAAKRAYGFRCISVERSHEHQTPQDAPQRTREAVDDN